MADIKWYDAPQTMYLARSWGGISKVLIHGETNRSWVSGRDEWDQRKYSRKDYIVVGPLEHWAESRRYRIVDAVQSCDIATLIRVAELVGYVEDRPND